MVLLSKLRNLRVNNDLAIAVSWIVRVKVLVVVLRLVEGLEWCYLSFYRMLPEFRGVEFLDDLLGGRSLVCVMVEYRGSVLGSDVSSLPVLGGRVVGREENCENVLVR